MEKKSIPYDVQLENEETNYEYDSEDEQWHQVRKKSEDEKMAPHTIGEGAGRKGIGVAANMIFLRHGIGTEASVGVSAAETGTEVYVTEVAKLKVCSADAGARAQHASAYASASPAGAGAAAKASVAEADASAALVEGVIEANSRAVAFGAEAHAGFGLEHLGAHAGAEACVGKAEAGLAHTPLKVHAKGPGAEAEAGVSWEYAGATVGAYAGEARVGPFAVRAGVKFGAGVRNGVPEVDMGPVTVPCSVM